VYEIAKVKHGDPGYSWMKLESIASSIIGSAKTMGVEVVR
jgi:ribosomal protein L11